MAVIVVEIPDEEMELVTARTQERGFDSPSDYMRALIEQDVQIGIEADELTDEQILENLKVAWREMKRGEGMTWEEMLEHLNVDDDD